MAQAFRNNRPLQQFVLTGVTPTGRVLGTGSYGSVEEVTYKHLVCAGKKLHETLIDVENEGVDRVVGKYLQECQLMASLHHPNITQFLGLCFFPGTRLPLLIMEKLETSLDDLLEHMPNLPLSLKRSVLEDVASGLLYQPPVIHRDLTSKNVLLTSSLVAKITDMGNSRIADMRPGQVARTMSALPGTLVYMPPEALDDRHRYGTSLDIFSFGHLALFVLIQTFPGDLLPNTYPNPDNIGEVRGRTELERRGRYIDSMEAEMGRIHPALVQLVKQCLHNVPDQRPSTDVLLTTLQRMRVEMEGEYGGPVKLDMVRVKQAKMLTQLQERHEAELVEKNRELEAVARELEELQAHMVQEMTRNDHINDGRVQQLQCEVEELRADLKLTETRLREELQSKETENSRLREELRKCQAQLQKKAKMLRWRPEPDLPFQMSGYVQSVIIQGTVYIGGGHAGLDNSYVVMAYDTSLGKWATLPPYRARDFALTAIKNQLVLVGGWVPGNVIEVVGVWRPDSKEWTHPYPDMPTPRSHCSAVAYKEWLVVAGGERYGGVELSSDSVEVLNTDTKQWSAGPPTPTPWSCMRPAIMGDVCYFMGGYIKGDFTNIVYSVSLPAYTSQLNSDVRDSQVWKEVSGLQVKHSSPLSISGSLLAVGGRDKDARAVSGIRLYKPDTGEWVKVGDLPTPRWNCTCVKLTDRELLVAGGWYGERVKRVDIVQVDR